MINLLLHALDFKVKSPHTIRTLSIFKLFFLLETEAPSKYFCLSFGFESDALGSFPLCLYLACALVESDIKRAWFLEVWRTPIWTNISCSCIKDSSKMSSEGIFQFGMEALPKWKVETNIEYSEPSLLSTKSTSCSSFMSIPHCLHCSARYLNLVKNCCMVSKLLAAMILDHSLEGVPESHLPYQTRI